MEREEEREQRGEERDELLWRAKVAALLQERNTQGLEQLNELRHIHRGIDALVAALPQPPGQLKKLAMIFGSTK
jgi:hypothetical protein